MPSVEAGATGKRFCDGILTAVGVLLVGNKHGIGSGNLYAKIMGVVNVSGNENLGG
jgi:hypothetical protein